jgi:hypothetical protein
MIIQQMSFFANKAAVRCAKFGRSKPSFIHSGCISIEQPISGLPIVSLFDRFVGGSRRSAFGSPD